MSKPEDIYNTPKYREEQAKLAERFEGQQEIVKRLRQKAFDSVHLLAKIDDLDKLRNLAEYIRCTIARRNKENMGGLNMKH